jgi:dTDP-4-dehydrorhamnose reductase
MKRVILTGANGLLGQKLVDLLANRRGVELLATGRGPNRVPIFEGYTYEECDLADYSALEKLVYDFKPTEIIHTAAMTNVDQCEKDPEGCKVQNVDVVRSLCALSKEIGCRLIHLSTDFIFDGAAGPYIETDMARPISVYGHSKLDAEQIVLAAGIPAAIIRTVLLYGVVADMSRTNIVLWVKKTLEAGEKARVVNDQWRSPTLAEDLADGVAAVLFKDRTGIYHISGAEQYCILDIAYAVADHWGLDRALIEPIDSATLKQPAMRPPRTGFIILKAQTELDYHPHSLKAGLEIVERQLQGEI